MTLDVEILKPIEMITEDEFKIIIGRIRNRMLREMSDRDFYLFDANDKRLSPLPWDINNGQCYNFACNVVDHFKGDNCSPSRTKEIEKHIVTLWNDDMSDYNEDIDDMCHCFLLFRNRFYDAECCDGVDDWRNLPANRPINPRPHQ